MHSEELFKIHEKLCKDSLELMIKKNHDYSGKSGKLVIVSERSIIYIYRLKIKIILYN